MTVWFTEKQSCQDYLCRMSTQRSSDSFSRVLLAAKWISKHLILFLYFFHDNMGPVFTWRKHAINLAISYALGERTKSVGSWEYAQHGMEFYELCLLVITVSHGCFSFEDILALFFLLLLVSDFIPWNFSTFKLSLLLHIAHGMLFFFLHSLNYWHIPKNCIFF